MRKIYDQNLMKIWKNFQANVSKVWERLREIVAGENLWSKFEENLKEISSKFKVPKYEKDWEKSERKFDRSLKGSWKKFLSCTE